MTDATLKRIKNATQDWYDSAKYSSTGGPANPYSFIAGATYEREFCEKEIAERVKNLITENDNLIIEKQKLQATIADLREEVKRLTGANNEAMRDEQAQQSLLERMADFLQGLETCEYSEEQLGIYSDLLYDYHNSNK